MNEERILAYMQLIQALLICPDGQENAVLEASIELVDQGLVMVMRQYAEDVRQDGQAGAADFLVNMAAQIEKAYGFEENFYFCKELFQAGMDGGKEAVFAVLAQNLTLVNGDLGQALIEFCQGILSQNDDPESAQIVLMAMLTETIADYLAGFSLGNRYENLLSAITVYQYVLSLRSDNLEKSTYIHYRLGNIYSDLALLSKNPKPVIENAIASYRSALQICTLDINCFVIGGSLGHLGFREGMWQIAVEGYEKAIASVENIHSWANDYSSAEIHARSVEVYTNIVQSFVNLAQHENAIKYAERSGLQHIIDLLRSNYSYPKNNVLEKHQENLTEFEKTIQYTSPSVLVEALLICPNEEEINISQSKEEDYQKLWTELIQAENERIKVSGSTQQYIYPILQRNLVLLDMSLAKTMQTWAVETSQQYFDPILCRNLALTNTDWGHRMRTWDAARGLQIKLEKIAALIENLSLAFSSFPLGYLPINLEIAIAGYRITLCMKQPQLDPVSWVKTQNNLANAYLYRLTGDRSENIEMAITEYIRVIEVYTQKEFTNEDLAMTHDNAGTAYVKILKGNKKEYIEELIAERDARKDKKQQAIDDFMSNCNFEDGDIEKLVALLDDPTDDLLKHLVFTDAFRKDWASTIDDLGCAYSMRLKGDLAENIEQAIALHSLALEVYTREEFPEDWAGVQINLGVAFLARRRGDRTDNIEQAILAYNRALDVFNRINFPQAWATIQNNLGAAYNVRIKSDRAKNIQNALSAYNLSLEIRTLESSPYDCLQTGVNIGNLAFTEGMWEIAIKGYEKAIEAVETTRSWATNDDRRAEILREAMGVYDNAIQSYINLGQYDKAISLTERSRSRHLVELMASNDAYAKGDIPPLVLEYLQKYEDLERRIEAERQRQARESDNKSTSEPAVVGATKAAEIYKRTLQNVTELSAEKDQIWRKIRALDPVLAGTLEVQPPDFAAMQALLKDQPKTAIVSFYSTNDNTHIFVLRTTGVTIHTCEKQGYSSLQVYLREQWLRPYAARSPQWQENMEANLTEISQRLELDKLIAEHLTDITELIIIPHIYLHLIPFAALPISGSPLPEGEGLGVREYLSDRFLLRILPSCQLLSFCQERDPIAIANYTTIENATDDLVMAGFECEQIAKICDIPSDRRIQGSRNANRENVSAKLLDKTNPTHLLHASHHAGSNLDYPLESALMLGNQETITLGQLLSPAWRMKDLEEVFLSCCETNLTNPNTNDDILTIGTGFLCAGARGVISTLWSVNDFATALFCIFYYEERKGNEEKKGCDRPTAIYNSQKRLRNLKGAEFKRDHPTRIALETYLNQQLEALGDLPENEKERDQLNDLITISIPALAAQPLPFAAPFYWSGFITQGLA